MIKLLKHLKPVYWALTLVIVGLVIGQVYLDLTLPEYMEEIVRAITFNLGLSEILWAGLKMLLVSLGSVALGIIIGYIASRIAAGFARDLRQRLFVNIEGFSMEEIKRFSTASLITRTTNDIQQIQQVITMFLRIAITAPTMAIGAIIKIVGKSGTLSAATGVAIFVMLAVIITLFVVITPRFKLIQKQTDALNSVTRENLTGLRVVRAYNTEKKEEAKFEKVNENLTKTNLFVNKASSLLMPSMQLIINGLSLTIVWLGAYLVNGNSIGLDNMMSFTLYAMQILMSFMMLTMIFIMLPRAVVSAGRINEVIQTKPNIQNPENPKQTKRDIKGTIEFKNVSFKYPDADEYVLENINFSVSPGETVAFIGSTGSGKSTLINLIPRFYDATEGEVLIDGINVKDYDIQDLNNKLGYVPQQGMLFSGTIESNIKYGSPDATEEEIYHALEVAQASEFVNALPDKLKYGISQGGKNVSGGQKQRLSIARAIVRNPEIYIFDDSFSALDYKTDKALREALKKETSHATSVIVAQRIGTIMDADKIVVLSEGKMVGIGTHKQLLKKCKQYKEIALSQLSKEELA